ncbi:MAG: protein kinase, partial [bacterium]|nr:protein kinase [bacterium]
MKCPKCQSTNPETKEFCGDCGTKLVTPAAAPTESSESPRAELTTGSVFAKRYKIIEELGQGGMGKVYKAIDNQLNEEVAIKLIKPEISSDKKTIKRFSNEWKLTRKISHRNVGRMYELMQEGGTYFITMEYVSGQDLKGLIRQTGQLAVGTTVSIAKQMCEGLSEAHRLGVIHRDLKPNNIMIDKGGNAKIMDFGIARSLSGKSLTKAGAMIGTPEYMSPEQAEGEEIDKCSDIYSLGIILFEMVTGRLPFEGETALSVAMKHKGETPKDPEEYNPQISNDMNSLILKCLEKEKESRYQEAGELLSELNNIEQGIPTTDRVVPRRKTTTSKEITVTLSMRRVLVPLLLVVGVVVVGVVIWKPWSEGAGQISIAVLPFDDLSQNNELEHWSNGLALELLTRLDTIESIKVSPRSSSFSLKEKGQASREIGQKLEVEYVLEGTL